MCGNVGQYQFEGDTFVAVFVKNVKGLCVCVWGWKEVSGVVRHPESLNILLACVQLPAPSSSSCVCETLSWQPARLWSELKQTSVAAICWSWGINQTASRPPAIELPWATAPARLPGATANLRRPTCGHSNPSQREERETQRERKRERVLECSVLILLESILYHALFCFIICSHLFLLTYNLSYSYLILEIVTSEL